MGCPGSVAVHGMNRGLAQRLCSGQSRAQYGPAIGLAVKVAARAQTLSIGAKSAAQILPSRFVRRQTSSRYWRWHLTRCALWSGIFGDVFLLPRSRRPSANEPRLNQIQVIGSHNSYHVAPGTGDPGDARLLAMPNEPRHSTTPIRPWPSNSRSWGSGRSSSTSTPIPRGVFRRAGGPGDGRAALGKDPGEDPDASGVLRQPGLKILHVPDIDFRTTAPTFVNALKQIRTGRRPTGATCRS